MNKNHRRLGVSGRLFFTISVLFSALSASPAIAQCVHVQDVSGNLTGQAPYSARMVYHAASGKMFALYQNAVGNEKDFYSYNGTTWTTLPTPPFGVRDTFAWVYDSARGVALMFGGSGTGAPELWSYDGTTWSQLTWTGPSPPRIGGGPWGAFDSNRGRAIFIYFGVGTSTTCQTWEWTGSGWEQGQSFSPNPPDEFIFDSGHNVGFISIRGDSAHEEVWYYRPGASASDGVWQQQTLSGVFYEAPLAATLAYDPYRQRIFRVCGHYPENIYAYSWAVDIWNFAQTNWDHVTSYSFPSSSDGRGSMLAAYDINRDLLVMAGGLSFHPDQDNNPAPTYWHDTWESSTDEPGLAGASETSVAHCTGDTAIFSVTPINGNVQWYHNAVLMPGRTSSLLVLNNLTNTDAGNYVARVENNCGYVDSPINRLHVDVPIQIFRPNVFPNCAELCLGGTANIFPPVSVNTGLELNYHLQKNFGSVEIPNWQDVRVSTGAARTNFVFNNIQSSFTGDYRFYIDGSTCPGVYESPYHIEVGFDIISQPQSLSNVRPCSTVSFSVGTSGGCALTYHWYSYTYGYLSDNGHFTGAQTPTLTINGVHYDDQGSYVCVVIDTNQCNNTQVSTLATLTLPLPQWVLRATNGPAPRRQSAMAYDSARGVSVLYAGGYTDPAAGYRGYGDVWEWDGAKWRQKFNYNQTNAWHQDINGYWVQNYSNTPAARLQHAMAYDSRRGRVVMFGGRGGPNGVFGDFEFNDTWEWDGTRWYFRTTNGPPAAFNHHMTYDPVRGVTVLYGGFGVSASIVWEWNGTNWSSISPTNGPVSNYYQDQMCLDFDTLLGTVFGGVSSDGFVAKYYWTWDGNNWHSRAPGFLFLNNFTPTEGNMVYDTYRFRSLHFGGLLNGNSGSYGGTAAGYYDSASDSWSVLPDEAQISTFQATDIVDVSSLAAKLGTHLDPVSQYVWTNLSTTDQQTVTNSAVTAQQKKNTLAAALNNIISNNIVYDSNRFSAVTLSTETVVFRRLNPVIEDLVRFNRLLLEDAYSAEIARSPSMPPGRAQFGMAFDSARRAAVVMGGYYGVNTPFQGDPSLEGDTWEFMYLDNPLINGQPTSQYRAPGDTAVFTVNAVAPYGTSLAYDWFKDSIPLSDGGRISGAHSAKLIITNVNPGDAGQYQARVSSGCGSIYSASAILTTDARLQIVRIDKTSAQLIWSAANSILEQSDTLTGPWSAVSGATSPFDVTLDGPARFFRLNIPIGP